MAQRALTCGITQDQLDAWGVPIGRSSGQGLSNEQRQNVLLNLGLTSSGDPKLTDILNSLRSGQSQTWAIMSDSTGVYTDANTQRLFYRSARQIADLLGSAYRVEFNQFDIAGQNNYGAPVIIQAGADGERCISFDGSASVRAATVSSTTVSETTGTGDRQWEFRIAPATVSGSIECIMAHSGGPGSRGWQIRKLANGDIALAWYPDPAVESTQTFTITAANAAIVADAVVDFKIVLDVDNGASGYTVTAYKSTNNRASWTQIQTSTVGGVTVVGIPASINYEIGARASTNEPFNGKIYRVQYRDGIDGGLLYPAMIDQWGTANSGNQVIQGSPTLHVYNGAVAGKSLLYFLSLTGNYPGGTTSSDGNDRLRKLLPPCVSGLITLNTGHNESIYTNMEILTALDTWHTTVRARCPGATMSATSQNPENAGSSSTSSQIRQQHAARLMLLKSWARSRGYVVFDTFKEFFSGGVLNASLINADGIHPTEPDGYIAGSRGITAQWGAQAAIS